MVGTAQGRLLPTLRSQFQTASFADVVSRSRRMCASFCRETFAPGRAWGTPDAQCTRSLVCNVESTRVVTTGPPDQPGAPARNGFNGFLRDLPGDRLVVTVACGLKFLQTRSGSQNSANLTPAPGRQDHTTSPYASASVVYAPFDRSRVQRTRPAITSYALTLPRPPHPAPHS